MRLFIFALAAVLLSSAAASAATSCTDKPQPVSAQRVLATMTYYAKPGQEQAVYTALLQQNQMLEKHGVRQPDVFKGPGGAKPAAYWQISFPSVAAHNAWLAATNKAMPKQDPVEPMVTRMVHEHYIWHDGWTDSPVCK